MTVSPILIAAVLYGAGVIVRAILPYILSRLDPSHGTVSFDWRYLIGSAITAAGGFVGLLLTSDLLETLSELLLSLGQYGPYVGYAVIFFAGYGITAVGRLAQKGNDVRVVRKNGN